jgi:beta-galactosidase
MAHGGTTFGLWGGCDRPFKPDTSSYDYDAPISEAGWVGEKFEQFRAVMKPYLLPGETLPDPPAPMPVIEIPPFTLTESAPVLANLPPKMIRDASPKSIEAYDISRGLISYRATLPAGPAGTLEPALVRDLAWVYLDGRPAGTIDTRVRRSRVTLPARTKPVTLEVLVYTIARVNFGVEVHDRKGLQGPVRVVPKAGAPLLIEDWQIRAIDFGADATLPPLVWQTGPATAPAFWRGSFGVAAPGDTFLDVSKWGMGVVWVNGHCLGRFWNIGPTQTMYLPGPWLKQGTNEIVVLDLNGPEKPEIAGVKVPVLDQLRPEKDTLPRTKRGQLLLTGVGPAHVGAFAPGIAPQEIRFAKTMTARQFCLESIDAFDGKEYAAVAEIALLDREGKTLNQSAWSIAYVDSEEIMGEDGSAINAINGQASDHWHTEWSASQPPHPHRLVIDLGADVAIAGFRYTPRQGAADAGGRIKNYRVYLGERLVAPAN